MFSVHNTLSSAIIFHCDDLSVFLSHLALEIEVFHEVVRLQLGIKGKEIVVNGLILVV